jgi:hypothetical protein
MAKWCAIAGMVRGDTYSYIIFAVNAGGTSAGSTAASATLIPPVPTGLVVTGLTNKEKVPERRRCASHRRLKHCISNGVLSTLYQSVRVSHFGVRGGFFQVTLSMRARLPKNAIM